MVGIANLSMGAIAIIAGTALLAFAFFGKPKKKDATMTLGAALVIGSLFFAPAAIGEVQNLFKGVQTAAVSGVGAQANVAVSGAQCERQTDGTNTLNVDYRNGANSSLAYLAASVTAEVDGESQASGTTTGGSSLSYLALNVPACQSGKIYSLQSTGAASSVIDYSSFALTSNYELVGTSANTVAVLGRSSTLSASSNGNTSGTGQTYAVSGAGTTDGAAYFLNTTLSSGSNLNFFVDYTVNGTFTGFGAQVNGAPASDGVILSLDTVDASKFSVNSMSLVSDTAGVSIAKVPCPSGITNNRNAEVCWQARSLKSSDGEIRLRGTLKADLGDPTESGDSPILYIDDNQYFRDSDGDVKYAAFDSSGTNVGSAGVSLTFVVA